MSQSVSQSVNQSLSQSVSQSKQSNSQSIYQTIDRSFKINHTIISIPYTSQSRQSIQALIYNILIYNILRTVSYRESSIYSSYSQGRCLDLAAGREAVEGEIVRRNRGRQVDVRWNAERSLPDLSGSSVATQLRSNLVSRSITWHKRYIALWVNWRVDQSQISYKYYRHLYERATTWVGALEQTLASIAPILLITYGFAPFWLASPYPCYPSPPSFTSRTIRRLASWPVLTQMRDITCLRRKLH